MTSTRPDGAKAASSRVSCQQSKTTCFGCLKLLVKHPVAFLRFGSDGFVSPQVQNHAASIRQIRGVVMAARWPFGQRRCARPLVCEFTTEMAPIS